MSEERIKPEAVKETTPKAAETAGKSELIEAELNKVVGGGMHEGGGLAWNGGVGDPIRTGNT